MITKEGTYQEFSIYSENGQPFRDIVLRKTTIDSVVMSLGDKITGDFIYKDNKLTFTMHEYIIYKDVKYFLVNPPTIVREGMVADNGELKGMTKYSVEFYHPMYILSNLPFSDIAVNSGEERYLSQNKTFFWIGYIADFVAKLNKNLAQTEWVVVMSDSITQDKLQTLSEVLSFDNNTIADALKTGYDTWEVPFVIDKLNEGEYTYTDPHNNVIDYYSSEGGSKRFVILFGLPSNEIYQVDSNGDFVLDANDEKVPFVFKFGQGVGLKNDSRTPRNNKIITRIAGYGSEDNIPYGYPQIVWQGDARWDFTEYEGEIQYDDKGKVTNQPTSRAFPLYMGIVGGAYVKLIKHPFTRTHLMPSIYAETIDKKVNPYNEHYNPDEEIIDYYDASDSAIYPNPIDPLAPSYEIHEFEKIKPQLGEAYIDNVLPYDKMLEEYITPQDFAAFIQSEIARVTDTLTQRHLAEMLQDFYAGQSVDKGFNGGGQTFNYQLEFGQYFCYARYSSFVTEFQKVVLVAESEPEIEWDDTMDDNGEYVQSYFRLTLPILSFDLYACASITQQMDINMRSGECMGCTFPVQVDWDDYKLNFYDSDGNFAPTGQQRDYTKYPDSSQQKITVIVQKDLDTFGTLMPNIYQQPKIGDKFVILGISLPLSYITIAQRDLDEAMKEYMLENNVYYYDYPLKFDEHFLANNLGILEQIRNNTIVRFTFAGNETPVLYVKQMTIKYGEKVLPQYDITLTDDVEIVLNKIGQVTDDVSRMRVQVEQLQYYYNKEFKAQLESKLSKTENDTAMGQIRFANNVEMARELILESVMRSPDYASGFVGSGFKIWKDNNNQWLAEVDGLTVRGTMNVYEMVVNKMRSVGGQIFVSKANAKIQRFDVDSQYYYLVFEDGNPFVVGDLIRCQTFTGTNVKSYWVRVQNIDNGIVKVSVPNEDWTNGTPAIGDELVLCGNDTDTTRQAAILISAAQEATGEPIISVLSGINSRSFANCLRTRLGYLGDITDNDLGGQLSGYGLYGENVYLKGTFLLKNGNTYVEIGESITAAVNNLEVGGRNLLVNSDFSYDNFRSNWGWNNLWGSENQVEHITTDLPEGLTSGVQFTATQAYSGIYATNSGSTQPKLFPLTAGKRYTISFWGKLTEAITGDDNNFYFGQEQQGGYVSVKLTTIWQRFTYTFTARADNAILFYTLKVGSFAITGLKLESGDKATDWTPSTEDTEAKISVVSNKIDLSISDLESGLETAGIHLDGSNSFISAIANKMSFYGTDGNEYIRWGVKSGVPYLIFLDSEGIERYNLGFTGLSKIIQDSEPQSWLTVRLMCGYMAGATYNAKDIWENFDNYTGQLHPPTRETRYVYQAGYYTDSQQQKTYWHGELDQHFYETDGVDINDDYAPTGTPMTGTWATDSMVSVNATTRKYPLYYFGTGNNAGTIIESKIIVIEKMVTQAGTIYYARYEGEGGVIGETITIPSQPE